MTRFFPLHVGTRICYAPAMSNLTRDQKRFLAELCPGDGHLFGAEESLIYGADASRLCGTPLAVVRPTQTDQVARLLTWARDENVPVHTRARATGLVGGAVPDAGGVVLSTLRMNRILDMDGEDFVAVTQPGVVTSELQEQLEAKGLFYPPDPASVEISTIGGNVATCAGGMRAVKYGVTRDFVLGLQAVLPGGEIIRLGGRSHKNVVGLDLARLFVGSEGTLGVITELTLKLLPLPEATASVLVCFETLDGALDGARALFAAGILPTALELMTRGVLDCVARTFGGSRSLPFPKDSGAALLIKLDGGREALSSDLARLEAVLEKAGPVHMQKGLGKDQEEPLWEVRRLINPASFQMAPDKLADDIAVPRGKVARALAGIEAVSAEVGLPILTFGHLGDGNIHVNVMYDAATQSDRAMAAKERVLDVVLDLGGTMSGEHGIGMLKRSYIDRQVGERELDLMRRVKAVFDPTNIMNPGKAY